MLRMSFVRPPGETHSDDGSLVQTALYPGPVTFGCLVQTFGCQMNVHASDRMAVVLVAAGGVPVERAEDADLVVFNTCSVREKAEQKLRSEGGKLAPLKQAGPGPVISGAG